MRRLFRKIVHCASLFLFVVLLCSCAEMPQETKAPPLDKSAFTYKTISMPEELASAYHIYHCYQNQTYSLLSVCSDNGKEIGPTVKTDYFALCDMEGLVASYPVETDAYITSALPYDDGVLYVDYVQQNDGSLIWYLIHKNGTAEVVLDTGNASNDLEVPALFYVEGVPYYLRKNGEGFSINKIEEHVVASVCSETEYDVLSTVKVCSNGNQYCFLVKYPQEELCRLYICDANGVKYQHKLTGKIASFTITDQYAVCCTGLEGAKKLSIEAINLSTYETKVFAQDYGAFYGLSGTGGVCVAVGNSWQPWAIDIENATVFSISAPRSKAPIFFHAASKNYFFVMIDSNKGYMFYSLTISENYNH